MQPFSVALRQIADIPGARYSCVADADTGDVLAEQGPPDPDPRAAIRWGGRLAAALRPSGELQDVMITTEGTYHLLRRVRAGSRPLLVHVSLDRSRGNLAAARRTLGALDLGMPPTTLSSATTAARTTPPTAIGLPSRTPRPVWPARAEGGAAPPSAVPPPRGRPSVPAPRVPEPGDRAPAIPEARGWSDDLHTMRRLLDALRRMH